jgi:hypothetical protein
MSNKDLNQRASEAMNKRVAEAMDAEITTALVSQSRYSSDIVICGDTAYIKHPNCGWTIFNPSEDYNQIIAAIEAKGWRLEIDWVQGQCLTTILHNGSEASVWSDEMSATEICKAFLVAVRTRRKNDE